MSQHETTPPTSIEVRQAAAVARASEPSDQRAPRSRRAKRAIGSVSGFLSPREILFILFKHRIRSLAVALTIMFLTMLAVLFLPSKYRSEAQLLVLIGRESMPTATAAIGAQAMPLVSRDTEINSETDVLRSRDVAELTARRVGVEKILKESLSTSPEKQDEQFTRAATLLQRGVDIKTEPMSAIITVSFASSKPETAQEIVREWVAAYLKHRSGVYGSQGSSRFFAEKSKAARDQLAAIELELNKVRNETRVSDPAQQKTILLARMANLQTDIDRANADLSASLKTIASVENEMASLPKEVVVGRSSGEAMGSLDQLKSKINEFRLEEQRLLSTFLESSPPVQIIREQLLQAEKQLAEGTKAGGAQTTGLNPIYQDLEGRLSNERANQEALDGRLATLVKNRADAEAGLSLLNDAEVKIGQLARDASMAEEQMKKYQQGTYVAQADEEIGGGDASNVRLTQAAALPDVPDSPNRKLLLLGGAFLAMVAGLAVAFASELLDTRIGKPQDLRKLGLNRVVSIPVVRMGRGDEPDDTLPRQSQALLDIAENDNSWSSGFSQAIDSLRPARYVRSTPRPGLPATPQRAAADSSSPRELLEKWTNGSNGAHAELNGHAHDSDHAPASPPVNGAAPRNNRPALSPRMVEACAALLERLVYSPVSNGEFSRPRSIAVVSVTPGQGTSTIAAHLASALSEYLPNAAVVGEENRVLLVDANLASPAQHRMLEIENTPGISDWLIDPNRAGSQMGEYIRRSGVAKLDVLPAGAASIGHQPGRWVDAVTAATQSGYHSIVVDLPSMAQSEATARTAALCDAAILVVECGRANREVVRQAALRLTDSGVNLLGVVLNKRIYPIPEKLYRKV